SHRIHTAQVGHGKRRKSDWGRADRRTSMAAAGDWLCGFIPGRLRVGGVVHGLGAKARIRALCGVSDRDRNSGAGVRRKTGELKTGSAGVPPAWWADRMPA